VVAVASIVTRAVTTHANGSVWNYLLSLPEEQGISRSQPRQGFCPSSFSKSEPQKRRVSSDSQVPLAPTDSSGSVGRTHDPVRARRVRAHSTF
jgi:hypothetical protein